MIQKWLDRAEQASESLHNGKNLFQAYAALLDFVWKNNWVGACHDTSAMLYIVLSEMGYSPTLVTGEVKSAVGIFDHSWVEVHGKIFDVAVGFPSEDGHYVGSSVFASLSLGTGEATELEFGVRSSSGLDEIGRFVANSNLEQYSKLQPLGSTIWDIAPMIGAACSIKLLGTDIRRKYGNVTRQIRGQ